MNKNYSLITYALDREPGGIGRYTVELLAALRQAGASMTVLNAGSAGAPEHAETLPGARLLPGLLTVGQLGIAWYALRRRLAVVHDPTGAMPLLLTPARRVVTIHDVIPYVYPHTSSRLDWLIYRCWLPLATRFADAIITDSECSRRDILQHLPVKAERVWVVSAAANPRYQPLPPEQVAPALARNGIDFPYMLYVGSLEARKNLPRLLEAFAEFRATRSDLKLVIVGARKWKFSPVFETVQRLGLEPYIHFTGYVEEDDLPALYNGASLFVFPSLYEGFGLPVLEAMSCGTPVITSNSSSLPEVAGDAALLIDPYDPHAIAQAMHHLLDNPEHTAEQRARGLARARTFTWQRAAQETLAVYEQIAR